MYKITEIELENLNIDEYYSTGDKVIYQTKEWINFICETQNVKPIILRITDDKAFVGYFTCFLFSKFGIKIIGSPFRGWTTLYMGFNVAEGVDRASLVKPVWQYLKKQYNCMYMEIIDRHLTFDDVQREGLLADKQETYIKDISEDIEQVFKSFSSTCKNQIRRYEKNDAYLNVCEPNDEFAEKYFNQLKVVFGYQNLVPSYDCERVKKLLKNLNYMADSVYCTEMCNPEGRSIGTLIGFAYKSTCYLFGLASYREEKYYQSDYLVWDSILHWKELGYTSYDLVGVRDYKLKFHPELVAVPRVICCRFKILIFMRNVAQKLFWAMNSIKGNLKKFVGLFTK